MVETGFPIPIPHSWGTSTYVSPSSSARVAMAMSADRGCSIEHTMGYRGGGRLSRGKGEPMVGVGYRGSKGPEQRKDTGEAKPIVTQPFPHLHPGLCSGSVTFPFAQVPFASHIGSRRPKTKPLSKSLLWAPTTPPSSPCSPALATLTVTFHVSDSHRLLGRVPQGLNSIFTQ